MSRSLGDLVVSAREGKGWSRKDLSAAAEVSYPYVSQIETGDRIPSLSTLRKLADALDLPVSDLAALVAPDAWAGSAPLLMSSSPVKDWQSQALPPISLAERAQRPDPARDRVKDSVRRKLREIPPVIRLQVLAELTSEAAQDLAGDS